MSRPLPKQQDGTCSSLGVYVRSREERCLTLPVGFLLGHEYLLETAHGSPAAGSPALGC